jgi:hypothetical protein
MAVFEKRVLRKMFESEGHEEIADWWKIHNE